MAGFIKSLTRNETQLLLDHCRSAHALPHEVLFELLLVTGLRTEELVTAKMRCFKQDSGIFHLEDAAKGSDGDMVWDLNIGGLADRLRAAYKRGDIAIFEDQPLVLLFTDRRQTPETAKRWLRDNWSRLRFKLYGPHFDLGIHSLRHTYGIMMRQLGQIEFVQKAMRHKSMQSTAKYMVTPTREEFLIVQREASAMMYDRLYNSDSE